jgi:hypothetical protein
MGNPLEMGCLEGFADRDARPFEFQRQHLEVESNQTMKGAMLF